MKPFGHPGIMKAGPRKGLMAESPYDQSGSMQGDPPKINWQEKLQEVLARKESERAFRAKSWYHFVQGRPYIYSGPDSSGHMSGTDFEPAVQAMRQFRDHPGRMLFIADGDAIPEGMTTIHLTDKEQDDE